MCEESKCFSVELKLGYTKSIAGVLQSPNMIGLNHKVSSIARIFMFFTLRYFPDATHQTLSVTMQCLHLA